MSTTATAWNTFARPAAWTTFTWKAIGALAATVDLRSSTTMYRNAVWTKSWSTSSTHTVRIVVAGTYNRPTITTDGIVYLK